MEKDIDLVNDEMVDTENFEKSDTEIETFELKEELKYPQDYENGGINIIDDIDEKEVNDPRVPAMFKRSRHNILSLF